MNQAATRNARAWIASGAAALCLLLAPAAARPQAWLPEKGQGTLTLNVSDALNKKHFLSTGAEGDFGHTRSQIFTFSGTYGLTDRLMLAAAVPYVRARYRGDFSHPSVVDDHHYHGTVTDLQLTLHYQASTGPVAFAPYVGAVIPLKEYPTLGHAAPGRGLNEYWLGFYTGASLNEWIPRTYFQARYNFAFVETVAGVHHDRSNFDLEIGHFLNESWSVRALLSRTWTHGGVPIPVPPSNPLFPHHDQLAAESLLNVGGGVSWTINDRLGGYALYSESLRGRNAHKVDNRFAFGLSYGFGRD